MRCEKELRHVLKCKIKKVKDISLTLHNSF